MVGGGSASTSTTMVTAVASRAPPGQNDPPAAGAGALSGFAKAEVEPSATAPTAVVPAAMKCRRLKSFACGAPLSSELVFAVMLSPSCYCLDWLALRASRQCDAGVRAWHPA